MILCMEQSPNGAGLKTHPRNSEMTTPKFNLTNENVDWAKWTWNPVTGCLHKCPYCYARDIANRFNPYKFEPHFWLERLAAPHNTKIPKSKENEPGIRNVFTVSMGDLFGDWVPLSWIEQIFYIIRKNTQWNFILLTKNPKRYAEFTFPRNCWIGATADTQERADIALDVFGKLNVPNIKFLSCEPLSEDISLGSTVLSRFPSIPIDWLIIGGRSKSTGMPAMQPKWEWVETLLGQARDFSIPIYFKQNLMVRPKEYPK